MSNCWTNSHLNTSELKTGMDCFLKQDFFPKVIMCFHYKYRYPEENNKIYSRDFKRLIVEDFF